jgi:hypothetical protein
VLHRFLGDAMPHALANSSTFMAGFGALFAFLSAFTIATEWQAQSSADAAADAEAAAATRLAWAANAPGLDTAGLQGQVAAYLEEVVTVEWPAMREGEHVHGNDSEVFRRLQASVRSAALASDVSPVASGELLAGLDDLADARRERLSLADRSLPLPLFLVLGFSGLAMCVNAALLTIPNTRRADVVFGAIATVVALDLGILLVVNGPYRGTLQTSPQPLAAVEADIERGDLAIPGS